MQWPSPRITHFGLNVSDLERSVAFFVNALGMRVMKRAQGRFATLSFGYQHHDIALIPARSPAPQAPLPVGLNHVCIDMQNYENWLMGYGRLFEAGHPVDRVIDHRTGLGLYFRDPDGNSIEMWCENHPSMEAAVRFGIEMSEEFEENHIGYPIDPDQLYKDYKRLKAERERAVRAPGRAEA